MAEKLSAPLDDFKPRELEILNLMAEGLSNREIGERLFITKQTVRWYNKQIYSKLGTSRRTEAIALARQMGLLGTTESDAHKTVRHSPPLTNGPFIGRDEEITELADLLTRPEVRLISIIAVGGMGKSRLSLELAHELITHYEHGVAFIDLTPARNADNIAQTALNTLGLSPQNGQDPREALLDYCREKTLLLIFDNMEHVLAGASLLADLLEVAPNVKLIATSRERLNLRVETVYYLHPVMESGATLFIEMIETMHPTITINDTEKQHIDRIVTLVGGLPLALTLAANWIDMLSVEEIADEIERSLDFLEAQLGDMPERHHSIRAVIDPTWNRLNDTERHAFMWLSVFRGGFTRKLFQQVTGASMRVLHTLLGRSLVQHGTNRRYDLHPTLRQYAREKLTERGELNTAKSTHLTVMHTYVNTHNRAMYDGKYLESLEALGQEHDNYRAALDWSLAGHEVEAGTELAIALYELWTTRSHAQEAHHYLSLALEHTLPDSLQAQALFWRGSFANRLGSHIMAVQDVKAALALAESLGDQETVARSLLAMGYLSSVDEERQFAKQALAISEALQHDQLIAFSLLQLGNCALGTTDSSESHDYYRRAETYFEKIGDLRGLSMVIYNAGLVYDKQGDSTRAIAHTERSLELKRQIGDRAGEARRLSVLAQHHIANEEYEKARLNLNQSQSICEEVGDLERLTYTLMMQGVIEFVTLQFEQALTILERGRAITEKLNKDARLCEYDNLIGILFLYQNQPEQAQPYIIRSLQSAEASGQLYPKWLGLMGYAQYLWHTGQSDLSVRITAVVYRQRDLGGVLDRRFLFASHIYRVEQHIGEAAWTAIQQETATITLNQLFKEISDQF